jgi:uncharacterized membrane protein
MAQPLRSDSISPGGFSSESIEATPKPARRSRIDSVDLLRGLVMVIMLIDHTRDFVHHDTFFYDPTDMSKTYPVLFFTRWITHFCAPVFVFLSGAGAYFQLARGKSKPELSKFLVTRGLWLIVLELFVIRFLVFWNFAYDQILGFAQVIWVIGWSMILLSILIYLPIRAIAAFGIGMIALHNLLDGVRVTPWQGPNSAVPGFIGHLWIILHQGGIALPFGFPGPIWLILYPLIPWLGVMAAGYAFGSIYNGTPEERRRTLMRWGLALTIGFILIRATNIYGDPRDWATQKSPLMTIASFLNLQKYPPSLLYLMMTIGPSMIALSFWERYNAKPGEQPKRGPIAQMLITYGKVPLFFYLLQWMYAHSAGYLLSLIAGKPTSMYFNLPGFGPPPSDNAGFSLLTVYAVWLAGVLLLYPLCKWYAGVKARRNDWWLSYL